MAKKFAELRAQITDDPERAERLAIIEAEVRADYEAHGGYDIDDV
jgi:CHASE3 domain sensor protein